MRVRPPLRHVTLRLRAPCIAALLLAIAAPQAAAQSASPAAVAAADPVQELLDLYDAGEYRLVARKGPAVLATRAPEGRLPMAVGNSLAWTGRYDEANAVYRRLIGTPQEAAGRIGMGNILRWRGMPDKAAEEFAAARKLSPDHPDLPAAEAFLTRDLRPATTFRYANTNDSDDQKRDDFVLGLRYWTADNKARIDVSGLSSRDERGGTISNDYREARVGVFLPSVPLSPRIEVGNGRAGRNTVVGLLQIEPVRDVFALRVARLDWGRTAFNSLALRDGLTADNAGATLNLEVPGARVRGRYDHYAISDGNRIADADLQVTPHWQPIPGGITWHVGGAWRKADRADPRYWSPDEAYGIATLALRRAWYWDDGEFGVSVQRGFHVTDGARNSWAYGLNGRLWLNKDWQIGLDASTSETPRPGTYRYTSFVLTIQKLW